MLGEDGQPLDKEARIALRRQRIEARLEAKKMGASDDAALLLDKADDRVNVSRSVAQTSDSRARLDKVSTTGHALVTDVRTRGDNRENERRIAEELSRQGRRQKLLYEAESSARQNAAVAMKWSALFDKQIPQELLYEIELQRDTCARIIASKDHLIREFKAELKLKDDEYVKALKRQAEDVDTLLQRMGAQFGAQRASYEDELEEIENAFMQERQELLDANKLELNRLLEKRQQLEGRFLEQRQARADDDAAQLDRQRVQDAEDYAILKIRLETEIQTLEQDLEEMRATYQLNSEKLDYNYRVLQERDQENTHTIQQQKRKVARLQDVLSGLKAKYAREDKKFKAENTDLTDEFKRLTEQFKELQSKFAHFEKADTRRYKELWNMNEEQVTATMRSVLQADKVIHEQQLGLHWYPPSDAIFNDGSASAAAAADAAAAAAAVDGGGARGEESGPLAGAQLDNEQIRGMLQLLTNEAAFLVEAKVQKLLEPLPLDEQNLLRIDSILKVLGVESAADVEKMLGYFLADADDHELIHPNDAIKAIKAFVEDHQRRADAAKGKARAAAQTADEQPGPSREEVEFWARMASIISDKTLRVWNALEKALLKHNELLISRHAKMNDVASLHVQNNELKALLNQYLASRVNEDLICPPTQTIRLDEFASFQNTGPMG
ncbi:hypothetical protein KFE25_013110 [Diacronema lutheri]|uniref:Dynein regulatory complex protein 1 n=1 Tax=Diacronema lutheri TaxID=2081491 RepID=A0A8J6C896_DIALT|nr:hypothetical protein KFE25_013110 [Diacronema lutheri]